MLTKSDTVQSSCLPFLFLIRLQRTGLRRRTCSCTQISVEARGERFRTQAEISASPSLGVLELVTPKARVPSWLRIPYTVRPMGHSAARESAKS